MQTYYGYGVVVYNNKTLVTIDNANIFFVNNILFRGAIIPTLAASCHITVTLCLHWMKYEY